MKLSDKNKDYEINHHQIADEIMEKIKANNNMWTIDDSNHNKDTFDVRFYTIIAEKDAGSLSQPYESGKFFIFIFFF